MDRYLQGAELRRLRLRSQMTLEALSAASGVSVRALGDLERGARQARRATLSAIADGLDLADEVRAKFMDPTRAPQGRSGPTRAREPRFYGREHERAWLSQFSVAANDDPMYPVVITGASGMGKSALALQASSRWAPDGLSVIDATGFDAGRADVHHLVSRLLSLASRPPARDLEAALLAWRDETVRRPRLTVVDNVGSEALGRALISAHPNGAIILTSRLPLQGLEGVRRLRVAPLSSDDSVSLLLGELSGPNDTETLAALAQLCDGIPAALAIVAALANSPSTDADAVLRSLRPPVGRLRLLTNGSTSLLTVLENSYRLLSIEGAALLRVIADPALTDITPPAVASRTARDPVDVEDSLDELVDFGLLEASASGEYRLLETVRLFVQGTL